MGCVIGWNRGVFSNNWRKRSVCLDLNLLLTTTTYFFKAVFSNSRALVISLNNNQRVVHRVGVFSWRGWEVSHRSSKERKGSKKKQKTVEDFLRTGRAFHSPGLWVRGSPSQRQSKMFEFPCAVTREVTLRVIYPSSSSGLPHQPRLLKSPPVQKSKTEQKPRKRISNGQRC